MIMALPRAQPAEVLRAWQKDDLYQKKFADWLSRLLPPQLASKSTTISSLLYKNYTTLKDLQTLGEEYSGIVQVDETYHKLPSYTNRLISVLLSVFGETITEQLLLKASSKIEKSSLTQDSRFELLFFFKAMYYIVPQIRSIHRALAYIRGGPIEIGKYVTGIDYIQVQPAAAAFYAHLRLLGYVTLLHAIISCVQSLTQALRVTNYHYTQQEKPSATLEESHNNYSTCDACLDELVFPCALQCGHLFCHNCCYGPLQSCALCRHPFTKNTVVPLMNFCPHEF